MNKKLIFVIVMVLMLHLFTACDSKKRGLDSGDNGKVTIRLLTRMAGTTVQVDIFKDIIAEFQQRHPEVVIIDDSQGDESSFNNILTTDIASGNMANIFRIQGIANLGKFIENDLLLDMSPFLEADKEWGDGFTSGSLSYYKVPGQEGIYGIPMESGLIGIYYNEKILQDAGIAVFPETWEDFVYAISKLKAAGVIPISLGAQSTYMAGHLHNQIFYKWMGTEAPKLLGARDIKWTDPEVVQTLQFVTDLIEADAFDPNAAGLTDDVAITQFQQGKSAMVITGPWNISSFTDAERTSEKENIRIAKFPYFKERPQFRDDDMQLISPYMVSGELKDRELDLTIELLKMLTDKKAAKRFAEEAAFLIPRTDIELDESISSDLFIQSVKLGATSEGLCVDVFDFDPLASMQDRTRNSIVGMFIGSTALEAATEIQTEIDNSL